MPDRDEMPIAHYLLQQAEFIAQMGSWHLDLATGSLIWSDGMYSLFGIDRDSFSGDVTEVTARAIHPDDQEMMAAINEAVVRDGLPRPADYRILLPDGSIRWVHAEGAQEFAPDGTVVALHGFVQDITEDKRIEAARADNEARLQALLDNAPYGAHIYRLDEDDRLVFTGYNRRAREILGIDHAPLIGLTLEEAFPGNVGTSTPDEYRRVAREGGTWETEQYAYDAEGIAGVFDVYAFSFGSNQVSVFFRDVTEKRRLEMALRDSEELYRATFEGAAIGMAHVGIDGTWLKVNQRLCDMLGYTAEELLTMTFGGLTHPDDLAEGLEHMRRLLAGEEDSYETEKRYLRKDGSVIWVNLSVTLIRDEQGIPTLFAPILEDITDRKQAEDALRESQLLLTSSVECQKDTLLFSIDSDYRYLYFNSAHRDAMNAAYGTDPSLGACILDLITSDEDRVVATENYDRALAGESHTNVRIYGDIQRAYYESFFNPVLNEDGEIIGATGLARDITDRRAAEDELRRTHAILQAALDQSSAGIAVADAPDGALRYVNDAGLLIRGGDRESIVDGIGIDRYVASWQLLDLGGRPLEPEEVPLARAVMFGETNSREFIIRRDDDNDRIVVGNAAPILDADGNVEAGIVVFTDLTDLKNTEAELLASNASLMSMVQDVTEAMGRIVEYRDPYTQGHEQRVAELAGQLARHMGLPAERVKCIEMASTVHDIGKLAVPAEILTKPGRLSSIEFDLIRVHSSAGYDILKDIHFPWPIADIVLQHHERLDGSGYPNGIKGDDILLEARIIAVADVVEAMCSHRPYRPALSLDAALEEVTSKPDLYDETVVAALVGMHEQGRLKFQVV